MAPEVTTMDRLKIFTGNANQALASEICSFLGRKVGEASVISRVPQLVKFCSEKYVRELVKRAMPGLALTHLPVPPPQVAARVEAQYFGLSKAGPCWESIVKHKHVGVYVPGDLPKPEMSIVILLDN